MMYLTKKPSYKDIGFCDASSKTSDNKVPINSTPLTITLYFLVT